jgi:hypothetical protein
MSSILEISRNAGYVNPQDYTYVFEHFDSVPQLLEDYKFEREEFEKRIKDLGGVPTEGGVNFLLDENDFNKLSNVDKQRKYGNQTTIRSTKPVDEFKNKKVFKDFKKLYDECLLDFDFAGAFTKQKIEITDRQNGVFDFSLASQGLYRPVEYFSEELKNESPNEFDYLDLPSGLVPPDLVDNVSAQGGGKIFFYTKREDGKEKQFICEQRQLGSTEVLIHNPNSKLVMAKNGLLYAEPSTADNGKYRVEFKTRNKRSYLTYFKEGGGKPRYVDLYIPINYICSSDIEDLAYIMPSIILAEQLEKAGTKTKISLFRSNYETGYCYGFNVGIKDYGEPLDLVKVCLYATGDNKNWMFANKGPNSWYTTRKLDRMGIKNKYWRGASGGTTYTSPIFLQSTIKRFFNYMTQERRDDSYSKAQEMKLSIWASTIKCPPVGWLNIPSDSYRYGDKVDRRFCFDLIKENTYLALDRISFAMRDGYTTAEMIGERMKREMSYEKVEVGGIRDYVKTNERKFTNSDIRDYITQVMIQSFQYPTGSNYSTPIKEEDILNREYEICLQQASKYLQTLK